jgi:hypothetical protein
MMEEIWDVGWRLAVSLFIVGALVVIWSKIYFLMTTRKSIESVDVS